ncbi:hypothetical protein Pla175_49540 [Pirellulimonas nuda]|uniref:Uncharacterized protein n=1 Tax=Pirellulimonas nuda TaxID=2528009 RepID=A0A518DJ75_9BACT|nr:hypothetical protein [Pirellulimonas nuda]QDU91525.1 hypothetical protein Pla175_49540 [Pirellulimonas nuda]
MQISIPEESAGLFRAKAAAAGFGDDIASYLSLLVAGDQTTSRPTTDQRADPEIDVLIDEGFASGPADRSWAAMIADCKRKALAESTSRQP